MSNDKKPYKCPECGAQVHYDADIEFWFCDGCLFSEDHMDAVLAGRATDG